MKINPFEIVNVVLVMLLMLLMKRERNVETLLIVLFAYGSLHFAFSAMLLISNDSYNLLNAIHYEGSGLLARLSTLVLLGSVFYLLYLKVRKVVSGERKILKIFSLLMGIILIGLIFSFKFGNWLQLKNVVSIEIMLALLFVGFIGVRNGSTLNMKSLHAWIVVGLIILSVANMIAVYEVFSHRSWAGTLESSGAMVYRASSILFNPNLYAFWASLVYIGCAYGMHAYQKHQKLMLYGMIMAAMALYFSGSRSACYLLVGLLFISTLLMKERLRWVPFIVLLLTMLAIYIGSSWFVQLFVDDHEGWHEIALLGTRFAAAPLHLINYLLMLAGITDNVPAEIVQSIEGRFLGEGPDSGWLTLYQDVGWIGLAAVICAVCTLVVWGVRVYMAHPSASSVYALAILFYCIFMGFVMKFQIFPVWLFVGLVLIPCLVFWRQNTLPNFSLRD